MIGTILGLAFIGSLLPSEDITASTLTTVATATEAPAPLVDTGPTADPAPVNESDWDSTEAYALDVSDTATKMSELMATFGDVATATSNGEITIDQFVSLSSTAAVTASTHYDHFNGTIPPPGFELTHEYMLNGLRAAVSGFEAASEGTLDGIERGGALIAQVGTEFDKATAALPS